MFMGQVWSKADFDGRARPALGNRGGRGSVLAVTTQNPGPDGEFGTSDDVLAPLNPFAEGVQVSVDSNPDESCNDTMDRIREFASLHPGGANFLFADGSIRFIHDEINSGIYQSLSTFRGREIISEDR